MKHLPFSILLITTTTLLLLLLTSSMAASPAPSPVLSAVGCDDKCGRRCANAGYKERCLKYCGICCGKCEGCVPSSPYADKGECPCYRDLKNSKGKPKCP